MSISANWWYRKFCKYSEVSIFAAKHKKDPYKMNVRIIELFKELSEASKFQKSFPQGITLIEWQKFLTSVRSNGLFSVENLRGPAGYGLLLCFENACRCESESVAIALRLCGAPLTQQDVLATTKSPTLKNVLTATESLPPSYSKVEKNQTPEFRSLLKNQSFSHGQQTLFCNQENLVANIPFFKDLLTEFSGCIDLTAIMSLEECYHFAKLLEFSDTGYLDIRHENFHIFFKLADKLSFPLLVKKLKCWLEEHPECQSWRSKYMEEAPVKKQARKLAPRNKFHDCLKKPYKLNTAYKWGDTATVLYNIRQSGLELIQDFKFANFAKEQPEMVHFLLTLTAYAWPLESLLGSIKGGFSDLVTKIVQENPQIISEKNSRITLPLITACKNSQEVIACFLIDQGFFLKEFDPSHCNLLHWTAKKKLISVAQKFLTLTPSAEKLVAIRSLDSELKTPLDIACETQYLPLIDLLLHTLDDTITLKDLERALSVAIECHAPNYARRWFNYAATSNKIALASKYAQKACAKETEELVYFFISNGADLWHRDKYQRTLLIHASEKNLLDLAKFIIARIQPSRCQAYIDGVSNRGSALHIACKNGNTEFVCWLLGYRPNVLGFLNGNILHAAVYTDINCFKEIFSRIPTDQRKQYINQTSEKHTPLLLACNASQGPIALHLLQEGAEVDESLFWMAAFKKLDTLALAILAKLPAEFINSTSTYRKAILDLNETNLPCVGDTPLMFALKKCPRLALKLMHFADILYLDSQSQVNMVHVAAKGDAECLKKLLSMLPKNLKKSFLDQQNVFLETPLMYACQAGKEENAELLIQSGADISLLTIQGQSALNFTIGSKSLAKKILAACSPKQAMICLNTVATCNKYPLTPLLQAIENRQIELIILFIQRGADITLVAKSSNSWKKISTLEELNKMSSIDKAEIIKALPKMAKFLNS